MLGQTPTPSLSCHWGPDSVSLFHLQRSQASHPLLPPQPLVLQLAEHLLLQPQPQPQLRQLQHQPQPQPDSQPPQPLPQPPQPQPQLQQPQQLGECRLLSPSHRPAPGRSPPASRRCVPNTQCHLHPQEGGVEKSRGLLRMDVVVGESRSRKFKWILASLWEGGDPPLGCFGGWDGVGGRFLLISASAGWVGWGGQAQSKGTNYSAETLGRAAGGSWGPPRSAPCFFGLV